uniref:Uncharacterized protein At3g49135 family n=1 Tax=Cajanus cajan TaxID=3821 RepID=A0A151U1Z8_CAJCA|nr:Uncharacterized protein At3g49135 family [Cajanus cajan]
MSHFLWLSTGHDMCLSKVHVAADYSDSIPDSSSDMNEQGYHPLEELRGSTDIQPARLSPTGIAKTTVEANNNALLVFPGTVHCEPHDQISWAEFQYHIDDFGDIYFEIFDGANLLADRGANNPVYSKSLFLQNALIGMDIPIYDNNRRTASEYDIFNNGNNDEFDDDDYIEVSEMEEYNIPVNWGLSDTANSVHPIYFSKCLSKAVNNMEYVKRMNRPSNAVSIIGYLRPAYGEEKSYLRMYHAEDGDFYSDSINDQRDMRLTLYRLEILKIELHSMYGYQACISKSSEISVLEFQDAEPDILARSSSAILERFNQFCDEALKALCKKKGLDAKVIQFFPTFPLCKSFKFKPIFISLLLLGFQEAYLVGVDSLGVDVRVLSGAEVKTHRFAFKVQAATVNAAEKQLWQLLFPRSQRKKNMKKWRAVSMS